jgi:hypothetical protein
MERDSTGDWEEIQVRITAELERILLKIEWYYGDNRAPFRFPPQFKIRSSKSNCPQYCCILQPDGSEDEPPWMFCADSPSALYNQVQEQLPGYLGLDITRGLM